MPENSRVRLAATLVAALGFVTSGAANAASGDQPASHIAANPTLMAVDASDGYRAELASKEKKDEKGKSKGKDGKGKDGSCKGKDGSCKGKDGSCKGKDDGGQLPGTGTGSDY